MMAASIQWLQARQVPTSPPVLEICVLGFGHIPHTLVCRDATVMTARLKMNIGWQWFAGDLKIGQSGMADSGTTVKPPIPTTSRKKIKENGFAADKNKELYYYMSDQRDDIVYIYKEGPSWINRE